MERLKIGSPVSTIILELSPSDLRELADQLELRAKLSPIGSSIFIPVSNSVSVLYNIPISSSIAGTSRRAENTFSRTHEILQANQII